MVTVRLIEGAQHTTPRQATFDDLERALHWKTGTCQRLLYGEDPVVDEARPSSLSYRGLLDSMVVTVPVTPVTKNLIEQLAVIEERTPADIVSDAVAAYLTQRVAQ